MNMKTIRKRGISAFLFLSLLMSATLVSAQGRLWQVVNT